MQVLHLHWNPSSNSESETTLFVWAETSDGPQAKHDRRRKKTLSHPFATEPQRLPSALSSIDPTIRLERDVLTFCLPTDRFGPQPSPQLVHDWERDPKSPELRPWHVNGLQLSPGRAFHLLTKLSQAGGLPHGMKLGADANFWLSATDFVLELLASQKFRPTLTAAINQSGQQQFDGRWVPLADEEEDAQRLIKLVAAMPPICRAATADPKKTVSARMLVESFLDSMCDAGARTWARPKADIVPRRASEPATAWVRSLMEATASVRATSSQLQHLFTSMQAWERTLYMSGTSDYRIAFRLEAPRQQGNDEDDAETQWQLHYLLQARNDASLLVAAAEAWKIRGSTLTALDRHFDRPQETLLVGLGYAGRFFEPIRESLQKRRPSGAVLSTEEAFQFLRHCAPQLQRAGFGLLVPPWWNKPGTRLGVRLKLNQKSDTANEAVAGSQHMQFGNLIHYQWELSLGETDLTREEFDALVSLKTPLVQIRGQWVQLDPDQIESAIRFWENQSLEGDTSLQNALQMGLGGTEATHGGLPVDGVEMDAWLNDWLAQLQGDEKLEELPVPLGLQAMLRPYQVYGYSWLDFAQRWGMGVILADDMGLGKTIQTLTLIQKRKEEMGASADESLPAPILLIAPTSVVANWEREAQKFTPSIRTLVHQGGERQRADEFIATAKTVDMVLTSYAIARRDGETLQQIDWESVILDEAQNIKNANTKQAQTIRRLSANSRLALTGTPIENRLSELWSIMQFLNPGYLGSQKKFRTDFSIPVEKHNDELAAQRLRRLTRPFILRRVKTDPTVIQDLPDKQEIKEYCTLSPEQATLYQSVVSEALRTIESEDQESEMRRRGLVLSMLMQLKQVCNHPVQYLHQGENYAPAEDENRSGKLERLYAMLEEILALGDRTLIFTQFSEMGGLLKDALQDRFGIEVIFLYGATPAKKRAEMVKRFQEEADGPKIFILSIKAGGTGLNLTRANHVFHFDRWWNPAVEDQATDRAFRIGQTKNVLVHKFVCLGTLEERIDAMIEEKKALAATIVGGGENWLTELSTADLRELVTLRA